MPVQTMLDKLLGKIFDGLHEKPRDGLEAGAYKQRRQDFIFHMSDWTTDLKEISDLLKHPECFDEESASRVVIGFLYHVIPHLNAAGRLLLGDVSDPFAAAEPKQVVATKK